MKTKLKISVKIFISYLPFYQITYVFILLIKNVYVIFFFDKGRLCPLRTTCGISAYHYYNDMVRVHNSRNAVCLEYCDDDDDVPIRIGLYNFRLSGTAPPSAVPIKTEVLIYIRWVGHIYSCRPLAHMAHTWVLWLNV